jgi:hypothetical protein
MAITTGHRLLTGFWTADVRVAEAAIRHFGSDDLSTDCHISFFELAGDGRLHVNVTHRYARRAPGGWAGPGSPPDGLVHQRTFSGTQARQITRHVRNMVFAART